MTESKKTRGVGYLMPGEGYDTQTHHHLTPDGTTVQHEWLRVWGGMSEPSRMSGELRLLIEGVFQDAVDKIKRYGPVGEAYEWLVNGEAEEVTSFNAICRLMSWDPETTRRVVIGRYCNRTAPEEIHDYISKRHCSRCGAYYMDRWRGRKRGRPRKEPIDGQPERHDISVGRIWSREYAREIRRRRFQPHRFVKQTHCGDCWREYHRNYMRRKRWSVDTNATEDRSA